MINFCLQPPVVPEPSEPSSAQEGEDGSSNGEGDNEAEPEAEPEPPMEAEVQPAPAPPPVWKRGFDIALNTLEQQIKDLEVCQVW